MDQENKLISGFKWTVVQQPAKTRARTTTTTRAPLLFEPFSTNPDKSAVFAWIDEFLSTQSPNKNNFIEDQPPKVVIDRETTVNRDTSQTPPPIFYYQTQNNNEAEVSQFGSNNNFEPQTTEKNPSIDEPFIYEFDSTPTISDLPFTDTSSGPGILLPSSSTRLFGKTLIPE